MEFCDFGTLENLRKMEVLVRLPACFFVFALAYPFLPALNAGWLRNGRETYKNCHCWRHTGAAVFALQENDPSGNVVTVLH